MNPLRRRRRASDSSIERTNATAAAAAFQASLAKGGFFAYLEADFARWFAIVG
jgi:hypothetical protein